MIKLFLVFISLLSLPQAKGQNYDYQLLRSVNRNDMPAWDRGMKSLSFTAYPVAPVTVAGILTHGYLAKDKVVVRNGYKSAITVVLAMSISTAVKYTVKRERPAIAFPGLIYQRDESSTYSFPSGHTTAAFATATALSLTYKKWYVVAPAYLYAGFMGYSRMRLGMHYPSDVLAGIVTGVGSGLLVWRIDKVINRRKIKQPTGQTQ